MRLALSALSLAALFLPLGAQAQAQPGGAAVRAHSYDVLFRRLDHYIDQDKAPAIRARLTAERERLLALPDDQSFMTALNALLFSLSGDKHLSVYLNHPAPPAAPGAAPAVDTHGIGAVERLPGNVALLRMDGFSNAPESAAAVDLAMARVAGARALIIDLRANTGGGEVSFKRLLGHLFPSRTEITAIEWRDCATPPADRPDACVGQTRRLEQRFTDTPPRPAFPSRPVYVLVGKGSFSAAEALAYELQAQGRATVIGQQTPGGGNPSAGMDLESDFVVIVPIGHMRPKVGTGWEGVGVTPDIRTDPADALAIALSRARR
jgi:hypothetical protein